jgi:hypothetical protein
MSMLTGDVAAHHKTGDDIQNLDTIGSLTCVECGYSLALAPIDAIPRCPACGGSRFKRASLFDQPTVDVEAVEPAPSPPDWLEELRTGAELDAPCLAYRDAGETIRVPLDHGWTRIGRSGSADLRLDDATVSRRHALVVRTEAAELRALDDRSLNGLFVNGERVDWVSLADGDELEIGRYRLYVVTPG